MGAVWSRIEITWTREASADPVTVGEGTVTPLAGAGGPHGAGRVRLEPPPPSSSGAGGSLASGSSASPGSRNWACSAWGWRSPSPSG